VLKGEKVLDVLQLDGLELPDTFHGDLVGNVGVVEGNPRDQKGLHHGKAPPGVGVGRMPDIRRAIDDPLVDLRAGEQGSPGETGDLDPAVCRLRQGIDPALDQGGLHGVGGRLEMGQGEVKHLVPGFVFGFGGGLRRSTAGQQGKQGQQDQPGKHLTFFHNHLYLQLLSGTSSFPCQPHHAALIRQGFQVGGHGFAAQRVLQGRGDLHQGNQHKGPFD